MVPVFDADRMTTVESPNHHPIFARADLLELLNYFGSDIVDGNGDVDGDGQSNVVDLLQLLSYFGGTCAASG